MEQQEGQEGGGWDDEASRDESRVFASVRLLISRVFAGEMSRVHSVFAIWDLLVLQDRVLEGDFFRQQRQRCWRGRVYMSWRLEGSEVGA